jgi:peptide/nickel transport system permease protein
MSRLRTAISLRRSSIKVWLTNWWRNLCHGWSLFRVNPIGLLGLALLIIFGLMMLAYPILMNTTWNPRIYDPIIGFDEKVFPNPSPPTAGHPLGTDSLGRDVLSQLLFSTRIAFGLGLLAALVSTIIAILMGSSAAYFGGIVDTILMQISDITMLVPPFVGILFLGVIFDMEIPHLAIAYGALSGLGMQSVIMKSQALALRVKPYVEAAKVAGGNAPHIIFTHIIPGLLPLAFLNMLFTVTGAVMAEAILSFFGRTQIRISWGTMIWFGQSYIMATVSQWQVMLPAAIAITLFCSAFYMIARALDEVMNPRLRKR